MFFKYFATYESIHGTPENKYIAYYRSDGTRIRFTEVGSTVLMSGPGGWEAFLEYSPAQCKALFRCIEFYEQITDGGGYVLVKSYVNPSFVGEDK